MHCEEDGTVSTLDNQTTCGQEICRFANRPHQWRAPFKSVGGCFHYYLLSLFVVCNLNNFDEKCLLLVVKKFSFSGMTNINHSVYT